MFSLTGPALMTFIAAIVLGLVLLLPIDLQYFDHETNKVITNKYDMKQRLFMLFFMSIPLAIHIYTIQCMVVGKCMTWSWIVSSLITLWIIMFVILAINI